MLPSVSLRPLSLGSPHVIYSLMSQSSSLDSFLEQRPLPVVALVGRTDLHHALTSRRSADDEIQARYLSLPEDTKHLDHTPSAGDEHSNVVLKRDWLHKHTHVVAAVVSLWFMWDADTPTAAILAAYHNFRSRCRENCKIVVVLVQRAGAAAQGVFGAATSPTNAKDDERLVALRKSAELDSRSLLTLSQVEGDGASARFEEGSVRRVERSLHEIALNYYKDESRNNKKLKQQGGKSAAPHIVARHHFKRAYYSEVRRDAPSAAKHWSACAGALRDVLRVVVAPTSEAERSLVRLGEVKRVAEFVNRKMTLSSFAANRTGEACDAFRRHVRLFRTLAHGPATARSAANAANLAAAGHVHYGWLCKQYRVFARLLETHKAPERAPPTATAAAGGGAHPQYAECGYYYQAAASCALERRKCAERLLVALGPPTGAQHPDAAQGADDDAAASSARMKAPPMTLPEKLVVDGVTARSLAAELGVPTEVSIAADSGLVIELLTRAYDHFKLSRQLRMILFLASQMAEEYFYAHDYEMAKRFFERVAKTYLKEAWHDVLAHIQRCLRVCAEQLGAPADFIHASVALLSSRLSQPKDAAAVLAALLRLFNRTPSAELTALADGTSPAPSPPSSSAAPVAAARPAPPAAAVSPRAHPPPKPLRRSPPRRAWSSTHLRRCSRAVWGGRPGSSTSVARRRSTSR